MMLHILTLSLVLTAQAFASERKCSAPEAKEPILYSTEFRWGTSLEEQRKKFEEVYRSGKRLKSRAYFDRDQQKYVMPLLRSSDVKLVSLPETFIQSVRRHIEISLERRYADFVFFPDMGHSHFFIPLKEWEKLQKIGVEDMHVFYEKLFSLPSLKILYHTAEQLKIREGEDFRGPLPQNDNELLWRYFTRNPVGDNGGGENIEQHFAWDNASYNTLHELPGYKYFGAGFNISASEQGCFPYSHKGKTYYFDISFEDLPYPMDGEGGWGVRMPYPYKDFTLGR